MRKSLLLFLFWLLCVLEVSAQVGFREIPWGSSEATVIKTEATKLWRIADTGSMTILHADGKQAGMPCSFAFIFVDNKLCRGVYVFRGDDQIEGHKDVKARLVGLYGEPLSDHAKWVRSLQMLTTRAYDPGAIRRGEVSHKTIWRTSGTEIELDLYGEKQITNLKLFYTSIKYHGLFQSAQTANEQKGF